MAGKPGSVETHGSRRELHADISTDQEVKKGSISQLSLSFSFPPAVDPGYAKVLLTFTEGLPSIS